MNQFQVGKIRGVVQQIEQSVQRAEYQSQGRSYFMRYIGKELELGGRHLFYLRIQRNEFTALLFFFLVYLPQFAVLEAYLSVDIKDVTGKGNEANHQ